MSEIHKLMKAGEWWAMHPDFPGYLIGSHGAAMSLLAAPKILSPIRIGEYDGYHLRHRDGKTVKRYRHRLVAETFIGPAPDGMECRHLDGRKKNADISNLRWATHQVNCDDQITHGTRSRGDAHGTSKLTTADVLEMRRLRGEGLFFSDIAKQFGVSKMTAYRATTKVSWRHV